MKTIDSHIHYQLPRTCDEILEALDATGCDYGNLVSEIQRLRSTENIDLLHAKYCSKGRLYCYCALNTELYYKQDKMAQGMVEHVKNIFECGADGIKMIEGKPSERKDFPIPNFDEECWELYWAYVEEKQIPIVWHVNDPEEFWDDKKVPDWARRSGWFYGEGDWINNEDQYSQIANVLKRHPNLCITFAHFYFLSAQLERLGKIFDECPNVCVDITPGIELFTNMSDDIKTSREFFIKYQDRILYGTDISFRPKNKDIEFNKLDALIRGQLCHDFILKDHVFIPGDERSLLGKDDLNINGLNLPKEVADKVLFGNFLRRTGSVPREVNIDKVLEEIEREKKRTAFLSSVKGVAPDYSVFDYCKEFFENEKNAK